MERLNADVLEHIFRLVPLQDQIRLKSISWFEEIIVARIWRTQFKKVILSTDALEEFQKPDAKVLFLDFMTCICGFAEDITFERIVVDPFRMLQNLVFPKVLTFSCEIRGGCGNHDQEVAQISKMFPILKTLRLSCAATGHAMWRMNKVMDLTLDNCDTLETQHFERILQTLELRKLSVLYLARHNTTWDDDGNIIKLPIPLYVGGVRAICTCKTLEQLCIDDDALVTIIDDVLSVLPNLRSLSFYLQKTSTFKYLMDKIFTSTHCDRIFSMSYGVIWTNDSFFEQLLSMKSLRKLVIHADIVLDEQFRKIGLNLPNLEEFHYTRACQLESDKGLLDIVRCCTILQLLDVSNTHVSADFLDSIVEILNAEQRPIDLPLKFYCFGTPVVKKLLSESNKPTCHPCLQVCIESPSVPDQYLRTFQCEWNLKDASREVHK